MTNPHPDSPEDILADYLKAVSEEIMTGDLNNMITGEWKAKDEALTKLDEYYTNKFLEVVGEDESKTKYEADEFWGGTSHKYTIYSTPKQKYRNQFRVELRQAIKQLSKEKNHG